jgi:hypothetical protein
MCESDAVATAMAHKIKRPLSVMIRNADPAVLWLDHSVPDIDKAKAALKRIADNGRRAGSVIGKHSNDVQERRACSLRLTTVPFPASSHVIALITAGQRAGRGSTWRAKSANYTP